MAYVPINLPMFLAAFSGALEGMSASQRVPTDPNPTDYTINDATAFAFAQAFDIAWNNAAAANVYEIDEAEALCMGAWDGRTPAFTPVSINPNTYTGEANALVAIIKSGDAFLTLMGITPPAGGTVTSVTATLPLKSSGGVNPNISATGFTSNTAGIPHVTAVVGGSTLDVAPQHGVTAGQEVQTNSTASDILFAFILGTWTADVVHGASPFTPTPAQRMVAVNTNAGVVTINTPLNQDGVSLPGDGQTFFIKDITGNAAISPITVAANGAGVKVENPNNPGNYGATGSITGQGACIGFKFRASNSTWVCFSGL